MKQTNQIVLIHKTNDVLYEIHREFIGAKTLKELITEMVIAKTK